MKIKKNIVLLIALFYIGGITFAQTAPKGVKLTPKEKKELNTFFSNFSEVFVEPFKKDDITDINLVKFSVLHNYRNNEKLFVRAAKSTS